MKLQLHPPLESLASPRVFLGCHVSKQHRHFSPGMQLTEVEGGRKEECQRRGILQPSKMKRRPSSISATSIHFVGDCHILRVFLPRRARSARQQKGRKEDGGREEDRFLATRSGQAKGGRASERASSAVVVSRSRRSRWTEFKKVGGEEERDV